MLAPFTARASEPMTPSCPARRGEEGAMNRDILLLGANAPDMEVLRTRLVRIGYRVVPAKTPEQAHAFLRVAGTRIGTVIVPSDMPVMNLRWFGCGRDRAPKVASGCQAGSSSGLIRSIYTRCGSR
jgi:hypothetical protein